MCFSKKINILCSFPRRTRKSGSLAPAGANFQPQLLPARRMLACRAKREQTTVGSRVYVLPSRWLRARDNVSATLFVVFSSVRKRHILLLCKGETCSFLVRTRKERKEIASLWLDHLCSRQRFDGGYKKRRPRSLCSRDPSTAAPFVNIAPEVAHTARVLRLLARVPSGTDLPHSE